MRAMAKLKSILGRMRTVGFLEMLCFLKPVFVCQDLYEATAENWRCDVSLIPDSLTFSRHSSSEPTGITQFDRKLGDGRTLYLTRIAENVVHEGSIFPFVRFPVRFGFPNCPVIGGCFTVPDYRGRQIYPATLRHILSEELNPQTCPRIHILVASDNTASIRGIEKSGFVKVARLSAWRIAGMLFFKRCSPA